MQNRFLIFCFFYVCFSLVTSWSMAQQEVVAHKITTPPLIDGIAQDLAWSKASPVVVKDGTIDLDITIKALYDDSRIYLVAQFLDPDESRVHKAWVWDKNNDTYVMGPKREDCFIFKWSMSGPEVDLRLSSLQPHKADIWFWKANRTDPLGFADDKMQILDTHPCRKCTKLVKDDGAILYLERLGDKGNPAYKLNIPMGYTGDEVNHYVSQQPGLSRGDIKAKGIWSAGSWTIEFSRLLKPGNDDDINFILGNKYLFGVTRYEIAGREPDQQTTQPYYGAGDVGERLLLRFAQ